MADKWTTSTFTLNSGAKIPAVGLGTWQSAPNEVREAVKTALLAGYRHIDTAFAYGNEHEVGQGIKDSGISRESIWITTKLDNKWHHRVADSLEASLSNLGVTYLDLYLVHWPSSTNPEDPRAHLPDWTFIDTWRDMQKLLDTGKVRNIGVSNFSIPNLTKLLEAATTKVVPAVNQIELHPNYPSGKLMAFCKSKGIHNTAYSCLGSSGSPVSKDPAVGAIADRMGKSRAQVLLKWGLQRGTSVIPKSVTPERIVANYDLDDWHLEADDMVKLSSLPERSKVCDGAFLPVGLQETLGFEHDE